MSLGLLDAVILLVSICARTVTLSKCIGLLNDCLFGESARERKRECVYLKVWGRISYPFLWSFLFYGGNCQQSSCRQR